MADLSLERTGRPGNVVGVVGCLGTMLLGSMAVLMVAVIALLTPAGTKASWYFTRSAAIVAYLLMTASMVWGLVLTTKIVKEFVPAPLAMGLHNWLSWLAVGLGSFHAFLLLFDNYYTYSLAHLLIPFIGPYRPGAVGLGIIGLYLLALTSASFSWRGWLGQKAWRRLHYLTYAAYVLVTIHGLLAGTDSQGLTMRIVYLGSVVLVLFLTNYRLLAAPKQRKETARGAA
jgi:predicted ferric reductase